MLKFASIQGDGQFFALSKCPTFRWRLVLFQTVASRDLAIAKWDEIGCGSNCSGAHSSGQLHY